MITLFFTFDFLKNKAGAFYAKIKQNRAQGCADFTLGGK